MGTAGRYLLAEEVGAEHREERAGEEAPVVPHREHLYSEARVGLPKAASKAWLPR